MEEDIPNRNDQKESQKDKKVWEGEGRTKKKGTATTGKRLKTRKGRLTGGKRREEESEEEEEV